MSDRTKVVFDTNEFLKDFDKITKNEIPSKAAQGLFKLGSVIIKDANEKTPMTPRDIGDLRASGKSWVDKLVLMVGFNRVYAARWHEAVKKKINWTTPGSGAKYLESKLSMYKNDYIKFVSKFIKK